METKKVLVTGGAGFIGSYLVDAFLEKNWEISVLDNCTAGNKICPQQIEKVQFLKGDIRNPKTVLEAAENCDVIIHLAAVVGVDEVIQRPVETIEIETIGTKNIAQAAKIFGIKKIIYASSSAVYKNTKGDRCQENDPLELANAYSIAKRLNELYLEALTKQNNISTNSLRFFNVYGGRQDRRMVVSRFFEQALNNEPIEVFGTGKQTRDFTHVSDVVKAVFKLANTHNINGTFNIARGKETNILNLAKMIKSLTGSTSEIQLLPFPKIRKDYKVKKRVGCSEKLFRAIGVKPKVKLIDGLELCYEEATKYINIPKPLKY